MVTRLINVSYRRITVIKAKPSKQDGMGAIPYEGGTSFRVWAPHADGVSVAGTFNNLSLIHI